VSDIPQIGPQLDPFGHDGDDETAALLRGALAREAQRVAPSPDGLQRIQREIRAGQARSRRPRFARLAPALVAAAAVAVLAVAGAVAVRLNQQPTGGGIPAGQPTATTTSEAPHGQVPVYVIGTQGGRKWLFREYRTSFIPDSDKDRRVAEAITDAVNLTPLDPDYDAPLFQGGPNSVATASVTPSQITVTLTAAMVSRHGVSAADARLALQQLVWTATAAAGTGPDVPVLIRVDSGNQTLFGQEPLDRQYTRGGLAPNPSAPLWIISLVDTTDAGHKDVQISGDAVTGTGGTVSWTLDRNGVEVANGEATIDPGTGSRRVWHLVAPTAGRAGEYLLTVTLTPGSGTGLSTAERWQDSRTFHVR
jgi:hypothetical protein